MQIKSMLVRLQNTLGCENLTEQLVLLPGSAYPSKSSHASSPRKKTQSVNLTVGYNGSPKSQTALDLALWIAHQTRLATPQQVVVQVIYVVEPSGTYRTVPAQFPQSASAQYEQADAILWQARSLAEEWQGTIKCHLRFGDVARELTEVVESEAATLLLLGCNSAESPLIQQLGRNFPCPVLGIPHALAEEKASKVPASV
ncbi:universal stress protein [Oscillatoria amoena NRMC-F 0135]|uniref:Universal stress protein n=2 Tax=Desertifilum tharense IPPAS B-1220 TaxID=1781255 RepID=A0ACD5GRK4_9CYAN|nr:MULTISPECIES: universal stress protein [Desertifilum]MDA0210331.1 universal stress protein [Cyanobacteria bacterium FC1]MDI9640843.1 universal stress protein [Geitlerinema splendidum]MDL5051670.1 universal stress protein [Oscillatoria amoena NRMC-F 0135]